MLFYYLKNVLYNEKYMFINKVYVYVKNFFREVKVFEIKMIKKKFFWYILNCLFY